jgi:hypothetical protein
MAASDHSSSTTTRNLCYLQVRAVCTERYHQRWVLNQHYMSVTDDMFFHLAQNGLLDKIVKLFQEADTKKETLSRMNGQKRSHEDDAKENDEGNSSTDLHSNTKKTQKSEYNHG